MGTRSTIPQLGSGKTTPFGRKPPLKAVVRFGLIGLGKYRCKQRCLH